MLDTKMEIRLSRIFRKQYAKASQKVQLVVRERFRIFEKDTHHPLLRNHLLTGEYHGFRSINITGDWRAIYGEKMLPTGKVAIDFMLLGTHSQLYKKN